MAQTFQAPKALWVLSLIGIGMWVTMTLYVGVDGIVHAFSNRADLTSIPTTTTAPRDPINSDGSINYDALPDGIKMSIIVMSLWTLTANVAFVGVIIGIVYVSMRFHKVWRAVAFGVVGIGAPVLAFAGNGLFGSDYEPPAPWDVDWHAIGGSAWSASVAVVSLVACALLLGVIPRRRAVAAPGQTFGD
ncbi:hypothetical protein Back2_28560 [Nocardioides baekrokdamisoli]|uniref:Uncharacterized protein n=1 Tax=Nocardioides baekrokdamisoli TaxID=1804624 RepID=A0A3G9J6C5_9ACTN|nr:hypothetical protein [Nocardioides baekrokdamisoli]BBH18569.1 hypothetical protein Back2_28560 [Nocardioides baekrokdamisoli]